MRIEHRCSNGTDAQVIFLVIEHVALAAHLRELVSKGQGIHGGLGGQSRQGLLTQQGIQFGLGQMSQEQFANR